MVSGNACCAGRVSRVFHRVLEVSKVCLVIKGNIVALEVAEIVGFFARCIIFVDIALLVADDLSVLDYGFRLSVSVEIACVGVGIDAVSVCDEVVYVDSVFKSIVCGVDLIVAVVILKSS